MLIFNILNNTQKSLGANHVNFQYFKYSILDYINLLTEYELPESVELPNIELGTTIFSSTRAAYINAATF